MSCARGRESSGRRGRFIAVRKTPHFVRAARRVAPSAPVERNGDAHWHSPRTIFHAAEGKRNEFLTFGIASGPPRYDPCERVARPRRWARPVRDPSRSAPEWAIGVHLSVSSATTGAPVSGLTPSSFAMHIGPSWNYSVAFAQEGRDRHTEATRIDQAEGRAGREHRRHVHDEADCGRG